MASIQDALTGKLAESAGIPAAVIGGATVSNALLGMPDTGFITLTEMEFVVARAASVCNIPILVDADAGYGNAINVYRTVRTLEQAGAAGIFIEDQENPPRGSEAHALVSASEMVGKIEAARDSRRSDSFVVVARTDSFAIEGLDAVIERGRSYVKAGAEGFFASGSLSINDMRRIVEEVPAHFHVGILRGAPGKTPQAELAHGVQSTLAELEGIGVDIVVSGMTPVRSGALATYRCFEAIKDGADANAKFLEDVAESPLEDWKEFSSFDWVRSLEEKYLPGR